MRNMLVLSAVCWVAFVVGGFLVNKPLLLVDAIFFAKYAPLFVSGIIYFYIWRTPEGKAHGVKLLLICYAAEIVSTIRFEHNVIPALLVETSFFAAFWMLATGWRMPDNRFRNALMAIGAISYPLYLLHQNIGVAALVTSSALLEGPASLAFLALVCIAMVIASTAVHRYVEEPGKRAIRDLSQGVRAWRKSY